MATVYRTAAATVAAVATIIPFVLTMKSLTNDANEATVRVIQHPYMRILLEYGTAYSSTGGDMLASILSVIVVEQVLSGIKMENIFRTK